MICNKTDCYRGSLLVGFRSGVSMLPESQAETVLQEHTKKVTLRDRRKLLRVFRKQYRVTLTELGELSDVSQPMLSQFERGDRDLSPEAWARVLVAIGKLVAVDKRLVDIAKAGKTAAKLGALPDIVLKQLLHMVENVNTDITDLTAQGYVIAPQSIEQERNELKAQVAKKDRRIAQLEEEIRTLKGQSK